MAKFIPLRTDSAEVFINIDTISRLSFEKSDTLAQSERVVKIVFIDGTNGTYVGHRDRAKELWASFELSKKYNDKQLAEFAAEKAE